MKLTLRSSFRIVAILEGISYILLLIATPIKYLLHNDQYVQFFGMPHGVLFILYVLLAIFIQKKMYWSNQELIIILLASIIPFGVFYIDQRYL